MRHKLRSITQNLALPSICSLCKQFHKGSFAVCKECIALFPSLGPSCHSCAYPLDKNTSYLVCGRCIKQPPHFDRALIAYAFEAPLRQLIHEFKYQSGLYLSTVFSELMLHAWRQNPIPLHCLIPVPMHPKKLRTRGFNQAAVLTKLLAHSLKLPYLLHSCQKILNTAPQAHLSGKQRQKNIRNAFSTQPVNYEQVTLVDDLFTTGATANELALCLKQNGVKQVTVWCCARAILENDT